MARLIAARRTAVAPRGGAFARLSIEELAAPVLLACLADAGIGPDQVDEVILSNALGAGGNPARRVALAAGLGHVGGLSIDRQCAGGLDAILLARALVDSGAADVVLAGGVESYSRRP
jgi:acetyl-CoA C-acetyltransferase